MRGVGFEARVYLGNGCRGANAQLSRQRRPRPCSPAPRSKPAGMASAQPARTYSYFSQPRALPARRAYRGPAEQ